MVTPVPSFPDLLAVRKDKNGLFIIARLRRRPAQPRTIVQSHYAQMQRPVRACSCRTHCRRRQAYGLAHNPSGCGQAVSNSYLTPKVSKLNTSMCQAKMLSPFLPAHRRQLAPAHHQRLPVLRLLQVQYSSQAQRLRTHAQASAGLLSATAN